MERPPVLVVEDHPGILRMLATILGAAFEVTTAADGAAGLSIVGQVPLAVVLTDIRMPGVTGFDLLREVQRLTPLTSVVMMTAYANVPDAVAAMRLGAFDYVAKPFEADDISLVVARAVEHRHQALERRSAARARDPPASQDASPQDVAVGFHRAVEQARERASSDYLARLMRHSHGNVTQAAALAGMTRESLHRLLKRYGVRPEPYRIPHEGSAAPDADGPSRLASRG